MRVLMGPAGDPVVEEGAEPSSREHLAALYSRPEGHDGPWLRVNFVATADGAAQGEDGRSGTINNAADKKVFVALRRLADVLIVGAGTLRTEEYRPTSIPLVVVSRSGRVPDTLCSAEPGRVLMATCANAPGLAEACETLGEEHVLVLGENEVHFLDLKAALADRGWVEQLSEGGPHLLHAMLAAGVVDELCLTITPRLIAGAHLRIVEGQPLDVPLEPTLLLEEDGTFLGRWRVRGE
ncbi:dihydrofolate reductase family protein [Nocardioides gansuensis]|nr:dihydrofolate reductase family protein [Nocardioides gansuensis]